MEKAQDISSGKSGEINSISENKNKGESSMNEDINLSNQIDSAPPCNTTNDDNISSMNMKSKHKSVKKRNST